MSRISNTKRIILLIICLALLGLAILFVLEKTHKTNLIKISSPQQQTTPQSAQTTSKAPSAQSSFTGGQPRKEATQSTINEGTVTDNRGTAVSPGSSADWTLSKDGKSIIAYAPVKNSVLKSGDLLTGTSTAKQVNFRLIDNVSGVIAQGTVTVSDGKFSGTFNFSNSATEGQVDLFTANADGVESNNISIPVRFK